MPRQNPDQTVEINDTYKHIVIEGNIGAGKTTAAKALAQDIEARLILEQFDDNPFLSKFYSDRDRYSFQVELHFLAERYQQLSKNLLGDIFQEFTIYDYFFVKSYIFSTINLSDDELVLFNNLYQIMERFMPRPDILIYLHYDNTQLLRHIQERGRDYESNIDRKYLENITSKYFSCFKEIRNHPVIILNMENEENSGKEIVLAKIKDILSKNWPKGLSQTVL